MTVAEYFALNRDAHGRAWLANRCWIEQAIGCFRLNMPGGEVQLLGTDDLQEAECLVSQILLTPHDDADAEAQVESPEGGSTDQPDELPHAVSGDAETGQVEIAEDDYADQFDEFRGNGAWPGLSADDAEPGDFEESNSDLLDDEFDDGAQDD